MKWYTDTDYLFDIQFTKKKIEHKFI